MNRTSPTEGITREELLTWMEEGLRAIQARSTDIEGIECLIDRLRTNMGGVIGKHCPPLAGQCEDLTPLQRQIDGLLSLQEGDVESQNEHRIMLRVRREYRMIAARVRQVFAGKRTPTAVLSGVDRQKPAVFSFTQFETTWDRVIRPQAERIRISTSSIDRLEGRERNMASFKFGVALQTLQDGLGYLYLDLPRPHIDSWLYLRHFRQGLEQLFDQMDVILQGCHEPFAQAHRRVYMQGMEAVEREVSTKYALRDEDEFAAPLIWASDFHRTSNEAFEECHQVDYDTQQAIDAFHHTAAGREFRPRYDALMQRQKAIGRRLLGRISREQWQQCAQEMDDWCGDLDRLQREYLVPHLGRRVANLITENARRARVLTDQRVGELFVKTEESARRHSGGPHTSVEDSAEVREAVEPQPVIGKYILLAICVHLNELGRIGEEDDLEFVELMRSDENYAKRYSVAYARFNVAQNLLLRALPDTVDLTAFRDFLEQVRDAFLKFERVMLVRNVGPIQILRASYLEGFDEIEREVGEIFAMQLPPPPPQPESQAPPTFLGRLRGLFTSARVPAAQQEPQLERREGLSRDGVWVELRAANRHADAIYDAALRKAGQEPQREEGTFEDMLQRAVVNLCPNPVKSLTDLEGIVYWLIGRIQAIESVIPHVSEEQTNWVREINKRQFAAALHRVSARLPQQPVQQTKALLSGPPDFGVVVGEDADVEIARYDLLKELSTGLARAETRIVGAIAKRAKPDHRQKTLRQYFARMQRAMETYMQQFCPETIRSIAPIIGLDSFLSELAYCSRHWLREAGTDSDDEQVSARIKINEAFIPVLQWSEMLLRSQSVDVDFFLAVNVGTIRQEAEEPRQTDSLPDSATLAGNPPPEFATALAASVLLDEQHLWRQMQEVCRSAERTLPEALRLAAENREELTHLIWRFRHLGFAVVEQMTADGPIQAIETYEKLFAILGALIDRLHGAYNGKVRDFLVQQFRAARDAIETRVCHEHAQREMVEAIAELPRPPQSPSQHAEFFNMYIRHLLAVACRRFFYSCITPDLDEGTVRGIGLAVDTTTETLAADVSQRIDAMCREARRGVPTLPELRRAVAEFVAQVDPGGLSLPAGQEDRFRREVLGGVTGALTACTHPRELFREHPQPGPETVVDGALEQEMQTVLHVRQDEQLAAMLQTARNDDAAARGGLFVMTDALRALDRRGSGQVVATRLELAGQALIASLFAEYASEAVAPQPEEDIHPRLAPLANLLVGVRQAAFDPTDPARQRRAINALQHLASIIRGFHRSLPPPA